ncbi:MAG: MoaD/ThiS family protein [Chloroflexi bacterium]|nr:MoaD/ThiS family protein [Chloroflexota bacterium]
MIVTVHLHTILQRPSPDGPQRQIEVEILSGSSITELMADIGVMLPGETLLLVVNGRVADSTHILQAGDQVHLMPALSGG